MSELMRVPRINTNDDTVELLTLRVQNEQLVAAGEDIADLGTSKATVALQSEHAGYIRWHADQYDVIGVGAVLCSFHASREAAAAAVAPPPSAAPAAQVAAVRSAVRVDFQLEQQKTAFDFVRLSPAAAELVAQKQIPAEALAGRGLLTVGALQRLLEPAPPPALDVGRLGVTRSQRVARAKRLEIEQLTAGERGNITSSLTVQLMSAPLRAWLQTTPFGNALQPILLFELARLLKQNERFTAFFADAHWHYYDRVDLGIALDLGTGLKVVKLANADELTALQIWDRITDYGLRYLRETLTPEELEGTTFTVTDLSGANVLSFRPLINGLQSAILGVGGDTSLPGQPLTLTLAFDHRVLTGREVAEFLNELKDALLRQP